MANSAFNQQSPTPVDLTSGVSGVLPTGNGGTGLSALGTGVGAFLGTPSSANLATALTDETGTGSLVFATSPTLTSPRISSSIRDSNGNYALGIFSSATPVNYVAVQNSNTGNAVLISAMGSDSNIDLSLLAQGTGKVLLDAYYQTPQTYTPAAAGTATLDLSTGNTHRITMPAGNITVALSNAANGQKFTVAITQDATGSRTVTWFTTIKWVGGVAPTLTTTASKRDVFGFECTGVGTYDGYVIGQNI